MLWETLQASSSKVVEVSRVFTIAFNKVRIWYITIRISSGNQSGIRTSWVSLLFQTLQELPKVRGSQRGYVHPIFGFRPGESQSGKLRSSDSTILKGWPSWLQRCSKDLDYWWDQFLDFFCSFLCWNHSGDRKALNWATCCCCCMFDYLIMSSI